MSRAFDPDDDYSGGWAELREGGEGAEDLYLGPVHPSDLPHGHIPHRRFASRPSVRSRPFADPIDELEAGRTPATVRLSPPIRAASAPVPPQSKVPAPNVTAAAPAKKDGGRRAAIASDWFGLDRDQWDRLRRTRRAKGSAEAVVLTVVDAVVLGYLPGKPSEPIQRRAVDVVLVAADSGWTLPLVWKIDGCLRHYGSVDAVPPGALEDVSHRLLCLVADRLAMSRQRSNADVRNLLWRKVVPSGTGRGPAESPTSSPVASIGNRPKGGVSSPHVVRPDCGGWSCQCGWRASPKRRLTELQAIDEHEGAMRALTPKGRKRANQRAERGGRLQRTQAAASSVSAESPWACRACGLRPDMLTGRCGCS